MSTETPQPEICMCETTEGEWRPCPSSLCERPEHLESRWHCDANSTQRDWLVTFAYKVALERNYSSHHPGHVFLVMLREDEAEGLLVQVNELVQRMSGLDDNKAEH